MARKAFYFNEADAELIRGIIAEVKAGRFNLPQRPSAESYYLDGDYSPTAECFIAYAKAYAEGTAEEDQGGIPGMDLLDQGTAEFDDVVYYRDVELMHIEDETPESEGSFRGTASLVSHQAVKGTDRRVYNISGAPVSKHEPFLVWKTRQGKWVTVGREVYQRAKLNAALLATESAEAQFYAHDGSDAADPWSLLPTTFTVHEFGLLESTQQIDDQSDIWVHWAYGRWWFSDTECANYSEQA